MTTPLPPRGSTDYYHWAQFVQNQITNVLDAKTDAESARDAAAAMLVAGTGVTITKDDALDTVTISASTADATDASTTTKGLVQLAGDLSGTATAPTVVSGASHGHTAAQVSDSTATGRSVLTAADAAAARTAIGAGTSSLVLGTTSTTAKAGNYTPPAATTSATGLVQLAGDLGGTATAPTVTGLAGKAARRLTQRAVTAAYTLVAADATDIVLHVTAASDVTVTLPADSAATIDTEVAIPWRQYAAGRITFAAGSGATVVSRGGVFRSAGQYAEGIATKVAANTWLVSGDLAA